MTAVRGRVDQHYSAWCPHHIAAPQIAVQPRRPVIVVEIACAATRDDGVDRGTGRSIESRRREFGHRDQSLLGVEVAPAPVPAQRHRQWSRQRPEEARSVPSVRPRAERRGARVVRDGQSAAEQVRRLACGSRRIKPSQRQARRVNRNNLGAGRAAVGPVPGTVLVFAGVLFHLSWMVFADVTLRLDRRDWRIRQSLIAVG